jgi:predicted transcriptional regulator
VKSTPKNYDKVMEVVENLYMGADFVKSIFPFLTPNFPNILNYVVKNQVKVKIILPENLIKNLLNTCKKFNLKEDQLTNIKIEKLNNHPNFSLIVTSKGVCLGFFRKDGVYDSKSLLVSNDSDAISWALSVFEDFKENEDNFTLRTTENFGVDDL